MQEPFLPSILSIAQTAVPDNMQTKLSIIIPAYNEETRLPRTLNLTIPFLKRQCYRGEIIVVTDGSTDNTVEVARAYSSEFPDLRVLEFKQNRGKGYAVKEGMLAARGAYRLLMDADYSVPVGSLPEFFHRLRTGYDIAIASRALRDSKVNADQGFPRKQLAVLFGYLQQAILQLPYRDTQCGFKLFTAEAVERFFPLVTYDCAYFDAQLLYIAHNSGARIAEVPVVWTHDQETRLPIGFARSLELLYKMWRIRQEHGKGHGRTICNGIARGSGLEKVR